MDNEDAREALDSAEAMAEQLRKQGRWHVSLVFFLGGAMLAVTLAHGLLVTDSTIGPLSMVGLLLFVALTVYTATRPVLPRHYRSVFAVLTSSGAGLFSLTVVVGIVIFPGELWWWLPGAVLCTAPFIVVGVLSLRARRREAVP